MVRLISLGLLAGILFGCQTQATREAPVAPPAPDPALPGIESALEESQARLDALDERFVLLQEQLLQANRQLDTLAQRSQQQLVALQRVQMLQASAAKAEAENAASGDSSALDQLTELVFRLEQLSANEDGGQAAQLPLGDALGFEIVSAVTHQGQWVILKYDEITGLTWNALDGGWVEVGEPEPLENSRYQVLLRPSRTDVKHYVAARLDRKTGQTWWLKNNRWEPFP
ncbi:hypothetical protein [Motiliproteus sp. SC1-56]|uniref:hypothetical protein n=1 Tax=Motiliproteus sp. SC1-56 TaxID=2799565 RepID=UPI001A8EC56F|nr:hypothetical protein [Motiliproteus sp. SC1-56]